jgi:DNA-binding transcriptional ArsR family regulator
MGLRERVDQMRETPVDKLFKELDDDDQRAEVLACLADESISARTLSRAILDEYQLTLSKDAITTWRRNHRGNGNGNGKKTN